MSSFGKRIDGPNGQRWIRRKRVGIAGSAVSFDGSRPVLIEDLSLSGARLRGRCLPAPGTGVLVRAGKRALFASVVWAVGDHCGVAFDFGRRSAHR